MEDLAAFSLAANIAQFIVIAGQIVEKLVNLSTKNQSLSKENEDLEAIIQEFVKEVPALQQLNSDVLENDRKLKSLSEKGKCVADEIQQKFDKIKARREKRRRPERLFATLKELKIADELDSLSRRVAVFRSEITLNINIILLNHQEQIKRNLNGQTENNHIYKSRIEAQLGDLTEKIDSLTFTESLDDRDQQTWKGTAKEFGELVKGFRSWYLQMLDFQKTQRIINSLEFSQIQGRQNAILDAHKDTYRWVFDGDVANLKSWLTTQDAPVYWISGKAGSGKSTLMKYIRWHPRLSPRLKTWAGSRKLYIASHFFWSAGTPMQQSQEGLLRTLISQILLECPKLVPEIFPEQYKRPLRHWEVSGTLKWTTKQLLDALISLPSLMDPDCLFIFIDGLDEYNGEPDALLEMIKCLAKVSNIKLCVSSRPWRRLTEAFGGSPWELCLQDLTSPDIKAYVRDNLELHSKFKQLSIRDENATRELVEKITERASGVFLWVYLVVKSIIRGVTNSSSMRDLHRILDDFPPKLEDFFDRILASIEDSYKVRTAQVFLVLAHSRTPMALISFYFLDHEEGLPCNPESFLSEWPAVNKEELDMITTKKRQLITQCKDLIQIIERPDDPPMFNFTASFLHRTVIDFIRQSRVHQHLVNVAGPDFSPVARLFEINARQFQSLIHLLPRVYLKPYLQNWYLASIYYAREMEVSLGLSNTQQLDQINKSLVSYLEERGMASYSFNEALLKLFAGPESITPIPPFQSFLDLATSVGLRLYVDNRAGTKKYLSQLLKPSFSIEQISGFVIEKVPSEMHSRPRVAVTHAGHYYSSTYHMLTVEEEGMCYQLQNEEIDRVRESTPGPVGNRPIRASMPPKELKSKRFKRFWLKVLRQSKISM
ncbi:hypothetical protein F5Y11DRAFT_351455 [Daldinia sp. FL1419]|nr:hypothetical protein F5Y11DRAFT_351455 [Daldinia sp. FL1419]